MQAAKIGTPHDPAPRLQVVPSESELLGELAQARSTYAAAIERRRETHTAIERAKLDADTSSFARRAAAAYLKGEDASSGLDADGHKARGALAALPALLDRLKTALAEEANAHANLRAVLSRIAAARRDVAAAAYHQAALALGAAWINLLGSDRMAVSFGARAIVPTAAVAVPVCALALDGTPKSDTSEANGARWLIAPDGMAHDAAAQRRAYENQQAVRALVPDGVPFPFDPGSEPPKHILERFR